MRLLASLFLAALLAGCATTGERDPKDPWEGFNRGMFTFNDKLDQAVLKPAAQGYVKVVPGFAREGVTNFFANLEDVGTSLNNFLQGKPRDGATDAGRFVVNTLLGVFGLWDIATPMGLEKHYEDFGQTLGVWGVQSGPYLVLPLLGPSSARDAPAKVVDPSWYYSTAVDNNTVYWSLWSLDKVNQRSILFQSEKVLDEAALDKYSFIRDAWLQRRRNQVFDGNPPRVKEEE
jgi:phospholipid-binding lipoprotein MlaA